jgi:hypothetical protein
VLVLTGGWMMGTMGDETDAFKTTLMVKMVFVLVSGIGAALHTFLKNPALKGISAGVGLVSALAVVLLGVSLVEA